MDNSLTVLVSICASTRRKVGFKSGNGEAGFSLTEGVLTLAVFAIVAGFGIPILTSSVQNWQVAADAREMATSLAAARLSATSNFTRYQLAISVAKNEWNLAKYNKTTKVFDRQGTTYTLSRGASFNASSTSAPTGFPSETSTSITFNSRGIPIDSAGNATGNNVIYFSNAKASLAVTVTLSGKVQVWKLQHSQWAVQ